MRGGLVGVLLIVLTVALVAAVLVRDLPAFEQDFADLVPQPDLVRWSVGDSNTLWLSTNRHFVDVKISSIALGLVDIEERNQGSDMPVILGEGPGCIDVVVASLTVEHQTGNTWRASGTIDRGPNATGAVDLYLRYYRQETQLPSQGTEIDIVVHPGSDTFQNNLVVADGMRRVQVSTDEHFPTAFTRTVDFDPSDTDSGGTVEAEEEFHFLERTGIKLIACDEAEDVLVTLHGEDDVELNRYFIDIGPEPTATPVPTPTPAPDVIQLTRRICVDASTDREAYLTGGESVGAALTAADFGLAGTLDSVELADTDDENGYIWYFEVTGTAQVAVTDLGASGTSGLDADQVYTLEVTGVDDTPAQAHLTLAAWLDTTEASANGDGLCS